MDSALWEHRPVIFIEKYQVANWFLLRSTKMKTTLIAAKKSFGAAIAELIKKQAAAGNTVALNDQILAFGTANDYIRWAASTKEILYHKLSERNSDRKPVVLESTIFTYLWTAADALFSRPGVHALIGKKPLKNNELGKFKNVYEFAAIPSADVTAKLKTLLDILNTEIELQEPVPGSVRTKMKIWEMIYLKYTVARQRTMGIGLYMHDCIASGQPFSPDLPTIVYASRNWHFHGVLLSSAFRGPVQRQLLFYRTLNEVMADVFGQFSSKIFGKI